MEGAFGQPVGERLAPEVLHHQEVNVFVMTHVKDGTDVRMAERGQHPGFALESLFQIRITRDMRGENLDGDRSVEPRVPRLVDLAHPAGTDPRHDFIGTETSARNRDSS